MVQDERRAVLFSTHITSDLDRVADHVSFLKEGSMVLAGSKDELLEGWLLVKGGEELLVSPLGPRVRGGQRTELGLELLCEAGAPVPAGALVERARLEDLVYLFGRELETLEARN